MDLDPETGGTFMDPVDNNEGWGWAELLTSPGYTLVIIISTCPLYSRLEIQPPLIELLLGSWNVVRCLGQLAVKACCTCCKNSSRFGDQVELDAQKTERHR